ncbi:MAG: 4-hydroxy-tetrahydrodipicolinate synthase, partial [Planctomycetes bacterium]|nr:4-hydroxy-tetrahydrodipicolinate synthase [Planctomycetota bacterium]
MFRGSIVALVTPFSGGVVDLPRLAELVEAQIAGGTSALVPCGTTGEAATLDRDEREAVLREVIRRAQAAGPGRAGRPIPVIAGTGTNNTRSTIEFTRAARQLGADAALIVCPYYNKPTQEGLFRHYAAVSEAVDLPIIAYNVPGRTAVSLTADTVSRIAALKNVVAIKEASGNLDLVSEIRLGSKITVLSGDDSLTLPILALGG